MRKVLSVTSECAPLVKTGGLADVAGALPAAMRGAGWEMRTILPGYPPVMRALKRGKCIWESADLMGVEARVLAGKAGQLDVFVLDAPLFFDRDGAIYLRKDGTDWPDNPERFAALSWAAAELAQGRMDTDWRPELVHCHDWQAALTPGYLRRSAVPSLLTIHNIAFHGLAPAAKLSSLRIPPDRYHSRGVEFWGQISALKAGLIDATRISTVSPTYARELTTEAFGMGLDGVIRERQADLSGILNGIDLEVWDPATDPAIDRFKTPRARVRNKAALRKRFDLPDAPGPLCGVVSRLTEQKGLDLLIEAAPALLDRGGQLVLLGSGSTELEQAFSDLAAAHDGVGVCIGYDEPLSHRIYAGCDAILVPSRFEPCGLTQLYALRYGAVPLVARTGGLADTVIDANDAALRAGVATGLQFAPVEAAALAQALASLTALYADRATWAQIQKNGLRHPVGWDQSAQRYGELYARIAG